MASVRLRGGQRLLLALLRLAGGEASRTRLMKWLFLLSRETDWGQRNCPYEFVPYRYGPFSFVAYHDLRKLTDLGLVEQGDESVRATSDRLPDLGDIPAAVGDIQGRYGAWSTTRLMAHVYRLYPWYALLSERPDLAPETPTRALAAPRAYTVGYGGRDLDQFLSLLLKGGLAGVVDVRHTPASRVYGYAGSTLARHLERLGLEYLAFPALGIAKAQRVGTDSPSARRALLEAYATRVRRGQDGLVDAVSSQMAERPLALMCMESDPRTCHRSTLAAIVAERAGLLVEHM